MYGTKRRYFQGSSFKEIVSKNKDLTEQGAVDLTIATIALKYTNPTQFVTLRTVWLSA